MRAREHRSPRAVAVARRKLACLCWQLLIKGEDYAFARPSRVRAKLRRVELQAGAPPLRTRHGGQRVSTDAAERDAERELTERAEVAYQRLIAD